MCDVYRIFLFLCIRPSIGSSNTVAHSSDFLKIFVVVRRVEIGRRSRGGVIYTRVVERHIISTTTHGLKQTE